jgi:hypothetical protein
MILPLHASIESLSSRIEPSHLLSLRLLINSEFERVNGRTDVEAKIPPNHYPHLIEFIFSQVVSSLQLKDEQHDSSWEDLFFQAYYYSSLHEDIFVTVESFLVDQFSNLATFLMKALRTHIIQRMESLRINHLKNVPDDNNPFCIPESTYFDLLLNLLRSQKYKQFIPRFIQEFTGATQDTQNETLNLVDDMISYATYKDCRYQRVLKNGSNDELSFSTIGLFFDCAELTDDDEWIIACDHSHNSSIDLEVYRRLFDLYTDFLLSNIYLESEEDSAEIEVSYSRIRADRWVESVFQILDSLNVPDGSLDGRRFLFLASILSVVFLRVIHTRDGIIADLLSRIRNRYSNVSHDHIDARMLYCWILLVMTQNMVKDGRKSNSAMNTKDCYNNLLCFKPICDYMNVSIGSIVHQKVSSSVIKILSVLPFGRENILSFATMTLGSELTRDKPSDTGTNGTQRIKTALDGLLILVRKEDGLYPYSTKLDVVGMQALCYISDLLVLNEPSLPLSSRKYLMKALIGLIENELCHKWTRDRLLHAFVSVLLQYFHRPSDICEDIEGEANSSWSRLYDNLSFIPAKALSTPPFENSSPIWKEDLQTLINVIFSLFKTREIIVDNTSFTNGTSKKEIVTLLDTIIPRKRAPAPAESQFVSTEKKKSDEVVKGIALSCFRSILKYLVRGDINHGSSGKEGITLNSSSVSIHHYINNLEEEEWEPCIPTFGQRPKYHSSLKTIDDNILPQDKKSQRMTRQLLSSLCEVFSEFLLGSKYIEATIIDSDIQEQLYSLRVVHGVNTLFDSRRKFVLSKRERKANERIFTSFCPEACANYFHLSTKYFRDCMEGRGLGKIKHIEYIMMSVPTLIDFCELIFGKVIDEKDKLATNHLVSCLWNFYKQGCSEKGCCVLIEFLRVHSSLQKSSVEYRQTKKSRYVLQGIQSPSNIEIFIRRLRLTVLSCFHSNFSKVLMQCQEWYLRKDIGDVSIIFFCIRVINDLCVELCSGLHGHSGGITKPMHQLIISMIKCYSKAVLDVPHDRVATGTYDGDIVKMQEMCMASSIALWNALCSTEINHPPLFKSSLQCCLMYLPQMSRRLDRMNLSTETSSSNPPLKVRSGSATNCSLIATALDQSLLKLVRFYNTIDGKKFEVEPKNDLGAKSGILVTKTSSNSIVSKQCGEVIIKGETLIQFTLNCTFLVVEQMWMESYQVIHARNAMVTDIKPNDCDDHVEQQKLNSAFKEHASRRGNEIGSILKIISLFFSPQIHFDDRNNSTTSGGGTEFNMDSMPAYLLSVDGKQRLCSMLDQMIVTLKESLLLASEFFSKRCDEPLYVLLDIDIAMLESLVCLVTWCSLVEDKFCVKNFTSGARNWYSLETQEDSMYGNDKLHHNRIFKTLYRMEELERSLQEFHVSLLNEDSIFPQVNELVLLLMVDSGYNVDGLSESALSHVIGRYIELTKALESSETSDSNINESVMTNERHTRKETRSLCQKRKCSGNGIIGDWLELDKEFSEKGRRIKDQFDDLADFLVEG